MGKDILGKCLVGYLIKIPKCCIKFIEMVMMNFKPFPILTTANLILRSLKISDADQIVKLRSNEMVNQFIERPKSINKSEAIKFIKKISAGKKDNSWIYWAITIKGNDSLIGTVCLWNIHFEKDMAEIGYELYPDFQGRGIMQESVVSVINWGFSIMKLKVITAFSKPHNLSSVKILLKNKFMLDDDYKFVSKKERAEYMVYYLKSDLESFN